MTDETNRHVIKDRLPNQYLPELIAINGRERVEALLQSHFISSSALDILLRDPFTPNDFDVFVRERQRTITAAIHSLLIGGRADLPADLRALDEDVERIELALRRFIAARLDNDPARLPQHIQPKIEGRIAGELRRTPGLDEHRFATLDGRLEFADLTELLDIIVAKGMEPIFSDIFPTKEGLTTKFGQLAALRNGIRHSRALGDVARLEGQAAIQWFGDALSKAQQAVTVT